MARHRPRAAEQPRKLVIRELTGDSRWVEWRGRGNLPGGWWGVQNIWKKKNWKFSVKRTQGISQL